MSSGSIHTLLRLVDPGGPFSLLRNNIYVFLIPCIPVAGDPGAPGIPGASPSGDLLPANMNFLSFPL